LFLAPEGYQFQHFEAQGDWNFRVDLSHCEGPEDIPFTNTVKNKFASPDILKSSVIAHICKAGLLYLFIIFSCFHYGMESVLCLLY
jgi:hypothetical protein